MPRVKATEYGVFDNGRKVASAKTMRSAMKKSKMIYDKEKKMDKMKMMKKKKMMKRKK